MDLICFSHLRWNFVYQRPQHLLSRFANHYRVFYVEEYICNDDEDGYFIDLNTENVWIVTPHLKEAAGGVNEINVRLEKIIQMLFSKKEINDYIFWYYSPMALPFTQHFKPKLIIYDCMDELSAFRFAPVALKNMEQELFKKAHIVFTGGYSLYQAKKTQHHNIYCFPSSIDKEHFYKARFSHNEPEDQINIPHPRLGFFGVLDERFDIELIGQIAAQKPKWHFILIGPVVKIDPGTLPRFHNIHYLGSKNYQELPVYVSGWDIAMIPFALNESTRFISPTKTPEYLAAGVPVISTAIQDVVNPYGERDLVHIINTADEFISKAAMELEKSNRQEWLSRVDTFLANNSWNNTWNEINEIINKELTATKNLRTIKKEIYV